MSETTQQEELKSEEKPKKNAPKRSSNVLIGLMVLVIALLLFSILGGKDDSRENNPDTEAQTNEEIENEVQQISFSSISPEEWEGVERAKKNIQSLTPGQEIVFGIVQDPTDLSIAYFASQAYDSTLEQNLISIYKYRLDTYEFERLFRTTYAKGGLNLISDSAIPVFHVVGYDHGKLVIIIQDRGFTQPPCTAPLLADVDDESEQNALVSMSINDPYGGFEKYTLPEEMVQLVESAQENCKNELM